MEFAPVKYVVPGYVAEGATVFAGKPKIGKSWWCLDVCLAVASGGVAMGTIDCEAGDVLYAALEDNGRRLKNRLSKISRDRPDIQWPERLTFLLELSRLDNGGIGEIRSWIEAADDPRLVVVDVFQRVKPPKGRNEAPYEADYRAVCMLQSLASETGVAIVIVMHLRKEGADDPFDTVSGTLGTTGGADTILVLRRTAQGVVLHGRGRDIEEVEIAVKFEADLCRWSIQGKADEFNLSETRRKIIEALRDAPDEEHAIKVADIVDASGLAQKSVRQTLPKMVKLGQASKAGHGKYYSSAF
jgi:hypothetical protein